MTVPGLNVRSLNTMTVWAIWLIDAQMELQQKRDALGHSIDIHAPLELGGLQGVKRRQSNP